LAIRSFDSTAAQAVVEGAEYETAPLNPPPRRYVLPRHVYVARTSHAPARVAQQSTGFMRNSVLPSATAKSYGSVAEGRPP